MTGIELITKERAEQANKHGYTPDTDKIYNRLGQLHVAAESLIESGLTDELRIANCPIGWDMSVWRKMATKPYKERLIIAAALLAAEIDRIS